MADNMQIFGYLEYNKFYDVYLKDKSEFENSIISFSQANKLLSIDIEKMNTSKSASTLVHKQNIKDIIDAG